MRRLIPLLILGLAFPVPVSAAETGDVIGVIRNETTGQAQRGVKVTLLHIERGQEEPELTTVTTDDRGRYEFLKLATGPDHVYALDAKHQGGVFAGGTIQLPEDTAERPIVETTLKVWNTIDDPNSIVLRRNDVFLIPRDNEIAVVDSYRVLNTTDLAYIGRGGAGASTTLAFPLPEEAAANGVSIVNEPRIDVPELRSTEFGIGITVAIPPGRTDFTFSYSVAGSGGSFDLTRTALYPILDSSVFAQDPLEVRSNRLEERGPETVGGEDYIEYSATDAIDAGDPIQLLAVAEAGISPWLVAIPVAVVVLLIALLLMLARVRRGRPSRPMVAEPATRPVRSREDLVIAIAELDVRYRTGELGPDEWRVRREELKSRAEERAPEPTP